MKWSLVPRRRQPVSGEVATLIARGVDSPVVWEGTATRDGDEVRLAIDRDFPFRVGDDVVIAAGTLGNREAAFGRLKGLHGSAATLATLSPWLPVNRRQQTRFPTAMPATVTARDGDHAAHVLDLSLGGLALTLPRTGLVGVSAITIGDASTTPLLPVRVVAVEDREDEIVLHAQFGTLSVQGHDYVSSLVGELSARLELGLARAA